MEKEKAKTQIAMKTLGAVLFFLNALAFILLMLIYGYESTDFFWGRTGHFAYIGTVVIADTLISAVIYILPQNWAQHDR